MGDLLNKKKHKPTDTLHVPHSRSTSSLIPGLPDEISLAILARVPRINYLKLKAVSRSWKAAVTTPEIYKVRKELGTTEEWLYILTNDQRVRFFWHTLDPVSKKWQKLPPIPDGSYPGCATGAVDGCLYMLGGFSTGSVMKCVWKYDPVSNSWSKANSMSVARAYCKTGVLNNKLFVVGGIRINHDGDIPLQSAEVYDTQTGLWSNLPNISFSKTHALRTANSTDLPQLFARELISYRGNLYVPQFLNSEQVDVDAGGEMYDPETNSWVDMPTGMSKGWPGAVVKISVNVDGDLYALDYLNYPLNTKIYLYNHVDGSWRVVYDEVPDPNLSGSVTYRLAVGLLGKLHVIKKDSYDIVVMKADKQNDLITSSGENVFSVIASMTSGYDDNLVSCETLDI